MCVVVVVVDKRSYIYIYIYAYIPQGRVCNLGPYTQDHLDKFLE
jgi:hypothetical protein